MTTITDQQLNRAFVTLLKLGIWPGRVAGATRARAAAELLVTIRARHPHARGAWAAWAQTEASLFVDGALVAPLVIWCSDEAVARAVVAWFIGFDIVSRHRAGADGPEVVVDPRDAGQATMPWRSVFSTTTRPSTNDSR